MGLTPEGGYRDPTFAKAASLEARKGEPLHAKYDGKTVKPGLYEAGVDPIKLGAEGGALVSHKERGLESGKKKKKNRPFINDGPVEYFPDIDRDPDQVGHWSDSGRKSGMGRHRSGN